MRRLVVAVVAVGCVAVPSAAPAATLDGPCATQQALFDKYGIVLDMHQEQVEQAYGTVCRITG